MAARLTVSSSIALRSAIIQKSGTPSGTSPSSAAAACLPSSAEQGRQRASARLCVHGNRHPQASHRGLVEGTPAAAAPPLPRRLASPRAHLPLCPDPGPCPALPPCRASAELQGSRPWPRPAPTRLILRRLGSAVDHVAAAVVQRCVQLLVLLLKGAPLLPAMWLGGWVWWWWRWWWWLGLVGGLVGGLVKRGGGVGWGGGGPARSVGWGRPSRREHAEQPASRGLPVARACHRCHQQCEQAPGAGEGDGKEGAGVRGTARLALRPTVHGSNGSVGGSSTKNTPWRGVHRGSLPASPPPPPTCIGRTAQPARHPAPLGTQCGCAPAPAATQCTRSTGPPCP